MDQTKDSPLEWLSTQVSAEYVSDLRHGIRSRKTTADLRLALRYAPVAQWSAGQWSEAASYLFDQPLSFPDEASAVAYIESRL